MTVLRDAYELIKDEDRWCTGTAARNKAGEAVEATSTEATRWCVIGAMLKYSDSIGEMGIEMGILADLARELFGVEGYTCLPAVNDNHGHDAVIQLLEKAIVQEDGGL